MHSLSLIRVMKMWMKQCDSLVVRICTMNWCCFAVLYACRIFCWFTRNTDFIWKQNSELFSDNVPMPQSHTETKYSDIQSLNIPPIHAICTKTMFYNSLKIDQNLKANKTNLNFITACVQVVFSCKAKFVSDLRVKLREKFADWGDSSQKLLTLTWKSTKR